MSSRIVEVLANMRVAEEVGRLTVSDAFPARPGQFYMLRCENSAVLLPRALSLCDRREGELHFLYKIVGRGTAELSRLCPGGRLRLTGPLGIGFEVENVSGSIALVGGGVGVAPLLYTARSLREKGVAADCYCGFPDQPFLLEEFYSAADAVYVATESGRTGHRGFVTDLLEPSRYSAVYCCGPTPMMRVVTQKCVDAGTPVYVSLENKMACGIGACLVCTCTDKLGKSLRTCADGPVFRGEEIDFDA